jgi:hypothetical protein
MTSMLAREFADERQKAFHAEAAQARRVRQAAASNKPSGRRWWWLFPATAHRFASAAAETESAPLSADVLEVHPTPDGAGEERRAAA